MRFERALPGTNEVFLPDGTPREVYGPVLGELGRTGPERWEERLRRAHGLLLEEQHSFGILEGDKTHPTDWIPRVVPASDWGRLVRGLEQRLRAINVFLRRLEAGKDEVVPREVLESSILYDVSTPNRFGAVPVRQIAFDVVAVESRRIGETGGWEYLVIEENAKMPVGLAAMTRRRKMSSEVFFPESHAELPVRPLDGWLARLGDALRAASRKGLDATLAVVTSGPEDQFYLDHHIYAAEMDAVLAETGELGFDGDGYLVHGSTGRRIDVIYERVDEDTLYAEVPGLLECHLEGKVHVLFAPNSEVVDDKGVGVFVPEMVRRYLGEEPLIENARTWSLAVEEDYRYVMDHFAELVVKSRGGYGGKEVMIGPEETGESVERFRRMVEKNPAEYVAQETIDFSTHVLCETDEEGFLLRDSYADYRMLVLAPDPEDPDVVETVPGSLSRVAAPSKHVVNISSGGKMKDTWVLGGQGL
ncbi:MAG TPA: circularly permuted type 2 ATP-grasp protein [Rubrobacteraceae bacterium]|nr:circularly permuted type 2 ATP-grasp protein [Rubrobacteraceae bacterium]